MRLLLVCFVFLTSINGFSQEVPFSIDTLNIKIDSLYREDQFYAGINYNSIVEKPEGVSQDKISFGFSIGFLRDMPLNKTRTFAIAPGIGLSFNNFIQNMAITGSSNDAVYTVLSGEIDYSKNRFEQWRIDAPIEIRWRNSTPENFSFFRIYGGFKFSYVFSDKSVYDDGNSKITISSNKDFEEFLYGVFLSFGYSGFNLNINYGLNSLFKTSAQINSDPLKMEILSIGLIFYIL